MSRIAGSTVIACPRCPAFRRPVRIPVLLLILVSEAKSVLLPIPLLVDQLLHVLVLVTPLLMIEDIASQV